MATLFMSLPAVLRTLRTSRRTFYRNIVGTGRIQPLIFRPATATAGGMRHKVKFLTADIERLKTELQAQRLKEKPA